MGTNTSDSRALIWKLQGIESNVNASAQKLEKTFKNAGKQLTSSNLPGSHVPNPIKLVRRLASLELALGHLRESCDEISSRRSNIVRLVIEKQDRNLSKVEKVLDSLQRTGESSRQEMDEVVDMSWDEMTKTWRQQHDLCCTTSMQS